MPFEAKVIKMSQKKMIWVVILSLIPGLSQLYLGMIKKSIFLLIISFGTILGFIYSYSYLMKLILLNIYLFTFLVTFLESYQIARYGRSIVDTESRWYVVTLLLITGFSAIPLLWHSRNFSRPEKIFWSIAVPVIAVLYFYFLIVYWNYLEGLLQKIVARHG